VSARRKTNAEGKAERPALPAKKEVDMKASFERTAKRFPTILSELAK
jgi:hypothetical protein